MNVSLVTTDVYSFLQYFLPIVVQAFCLIWGLLICKRPSNWKGKRPGSKKKPTWKGGLGRMPSWQFPGRSGDNLGSRSSQTLTDDRNKACIGPNYTKHPNDDFPNAQSSHIAQSALVGPHSQHYAPLFKCKVKRVPRLEDEADEGSERVEGLYSDLQGVREKRVTFDNRARFALIPHDQDKPHNLRKDRQINNPERKLYVRNKIKMIGGYLRDRRSGDIKYVPPMQIADDGDCYV